MPLPPLSRRALLAGAAPALLAACGLHRAAPPSPAQQALWQLLERSDEAMLDRQPMAALYRGDLRHADRYGDELSDDFIAAERRAAQDDLAALAAIPRDALPPRAQAVHDSFRWLREDRLALMSPPATGVWPYLPLDHQGGPQLHFTSLSSGDGAAPYAAVKDYEDGLARIDGFVAWLDRAVARMREGIARGVVQPRVVVDAMLPQFARLAAQDAATTPYLAPVRAFPDGVPAAQRPRLARAYAAAWDGRLRPAFVRMQRFLADTYRPAARDSVGLAALPGGAAYYALLVRSHTTTAMSVDEVHALGIAEVARLAGTMDAVRREVGFSGPPAAFFERLRSDPAFRPASAEALGDGYRAIGRRVAAAMPALFARQPATPLEIRPMSALEGPGGPGAYYLPGAPALARPGVFFFNAHDLASRPTWGMETLYLHEAVPGHHLQTMLAIEDASLPKLLRFDGTTAFSEGWALYAERLGPELGLFTDPYQRFGHANDGMLRAMRLVVDTGLHARGWTRQQAVDYMRTHSAMSAVDVDAEVDRYIVDPGQALAYQVGAQAIHGLRAEAEAALGARFDPRDFHRQVLATGAVPLSALQASVRGWLAARR